MSYRQLMEGSVLECDLPIASPPLVVHNELVLSGRAASPGGTSGVIVELDGRTFNACYGLDSTALAEILPETPGADRAGYHIRIDTSTWAPGCRDVALSAYDAEGGRAVIEGQLDIRPFEEAGATAEANLAALARGGRAMWLDEPRFRDGRAEIDGELRISGWAHLEDGVEAVVVTLDGHIQYDAVRPIVRPDLLDVHGADIAAEAGFAVRLHAADCPPGRHSLSVVALGRDGHSAVGVEGELRCQASPSIDDEQLADGYTHVEWIENDDSATPRKRVQRTAKQDDRAVALPSSPEGVRRLHATALMWEDRALLAEADAAVSRTEARLARAHQEGALGVLQATEAKLRAARLAHAELEAARRDLDATKQRLAGVERDREDARVELARARAALQAREEELTRRSALLESQRSSLSWRMTRPLRSVKRGWLRSLARLR